jgi:hypothetical protein
MRIFTHRRVGRPLITACAAVLFSTSLLAQTAPPPIPGATGVVKPEKGGDGATTAIGEAAGKVVGALKSVTGNGDKRNALDTLDALQPGMKVVIRDPAAARIDSANGRTSTSTPEVTETEATTIDIDRRTSVIVVRLADRTTERLRLVKRAKAASDRDGKATESSAGTVDVSYVDANGNRVLQLFDKVP